LNIFVWAHHGWDFVIRAIHQYQFPIG